MCCTLLLPSCDFGTSFDQLVLLRVNLQGAVILQQGKCLLLVLKFILCVYVLALFSFFVCALKYDCVFCWWSCCLCCLLIFALMLLFFIHVQHLQKCECMPCCGRASFLNCCLAHALWRCGAWCRFLKRWKPYECFRPRLVFHCIALQIVVFSSLLPHCNLFWSSG